VLSTDRVVHDLYGDPDVRDAVVARFGPAVAPSGKIDRAALARVAFATPEDRAWLEALLWPRVGDEVARFRRRQDGVSPRPRAVVVEVPLLFESGLDSIFDATCANVAGADLHRQRAAGRGHAALEERSARQLSQAEKARRATSVVSNDGTLDQLEQRLSAILDMLQR
jgi:dephospho-CoA kinase